VCGSVCVSEFLCERERACECIDTSTNGASVRECMCGCGCGMSVIDSSTKRAMELFEVLFLCVHVCVCVSYIYTHVCTRAHAKICMGFSGSAHRIHHRDRCA